MMSHNTYKVYFNERLIGISNNMDTCSKRLNSTIYKVIKNFDISAIIKQFLSNEHLLELWLCAEEPKAVFDALCALFTRVEAAGGLVRNISGDILMIYRNGRWDLPKGKRDKGENLSETALREVEEECGVRDLNLYDLIDTTYHTYREKGEIILKSTHWYQMEYRGNTQPIPQAIEGIEKAEWITMEKIPEYNDSYFPSIREILCKTGLLDEAHL